MSNSINRLRILFFGMTGTLSQAPLSALVAAGMPVCGVVLPVARVPPFQLPQHGRAAAPILPIHLKPPAATLLPLRPDSTVLELAAHYRIPAFGVRDLKTAVSVATLQALAPELICVSCFPHRLPPAILQLPRIGCLNVHPSLLPHFRGPAPLFWTFRRGVRQTGVTIHLMDEGFDTGDIILQRPLTLPDGISGPEAQQILAQLGGELLVDAVQALAAGNVSGKPQPAGFNADPWPRDADFELFTHWPARRAFNFMRGTAVWGQPYFITLGEQKVWLSQALVYQPGRVLPQPVVSRDGHLAIQFSDGVLLAVSGVERP